MRGGTAQKSNPLAFYTPFLTEEVPSIEKWYPFHISSLEFCILLERFSCSWNENARTKQKNQTNGNSAIWLVYRTDLTNARGFWLVKRTLGSKKNHARELSRKQWILCFDVILQHDWPIERYLLCNSVFFGGKTKSPCFDLFIHWLIKQIMNTYRNRFSRSYENHSNCCKCTVVKI